MIVVVVAILSQHPLVNYFATHYSLSKCPPHFSDTEPAEKRLRKELVSYREAIFSQYVDTFHIELQKNY